MSQLAALLRTAPMPLHDMAEQVRQHGRKGDTVLAHINPREVEILKKHGGSGRINPATGIMEFAYDDPYQPQQDTTSSQPYTPPTETTAPATDATAPMAGSTPAQDVVAPTDFTDYRSNTGSAPFQPQPTQQTPQAQPDPLPQFAPTPYQQDPGPVVASAPEQKSQDWLGTGGKIDQGLGGLRKALGTDNMGLARVGLGGLSAIQGLQGSRTAQKQAGQMQDQIAALAAPYKAQGQQLLQTGQAGGLTADQQQKINAQRAQNQQMLANMGQSGNSTTAAQLENQIQIMAQQFAQQNIDQGMKLINMGDQYAMAAIKAGYLASGDAQTASANFFKNLLQSLPGQTQTVPKVDPNVPVPG